MLRVIAFASLIVLGVSFTDAAVFAEHVSVQGYVRDAKTGEPLLGATVMFVGTSMGAATDMKGKYIIPNVPPGNYTIKVIYIGYEEWKSAITVAGENFQQDFKLDPVGVMGTEVVVTAQAAGQNAAINQQLSSTQIVNVVSAAKIQELPDANAAESVGRLPGVFVLRSGGEGYEVAIRGLQPKYNEVTIDGIKMGASDASDRSTDLSMISSDMLEGIEVKKTVTADMDADVIGGVVNFDMREAQVKETGIPEFSLLAQGGYKDLPDALNKYNNYKYVGSVEDRLMNDRLGVFAQIDIDRRNLTANELSASYNHLANSTTQYITNELSLFYLPSDRQRYNGALNLDYKLPEGRISFINFVSSSNTNSQQAENDYVVSTPALSTAQTYQLSTLNNVVNNIANILDFEQQLPVFHLDLKLSHTYSETKSPDNWGVNFSQPSQSLNQFINKPNVNPQDVLKAGNDDFFFGLFGHFAQR